MLWFGASFQDIFLRLGWFIGGVDAEPSQKTLYYTIKA